MDVAVAVALAVAADADAAAAAAVHVVVVRDAVGAHNGEGYLRGVSEEKPGRLLADPA